MSTLKIDSKSIAYLLTLTMLFSLTLAGCNNTSISDSESIGTSPSESQEVVKTEGTAADQAPAIPEEAISDDGKHIDLAKLIALETGTAYGIDVSHHQGEINWLELEKVGVHFAYIKATEGTDWTDPLYLNNWLGFKEIGIPAGAYHMFHPEDSAVEQAEYFIAALRQVNYSDDDLPPVLDIEQVKGIKDVSHADLHKRAVDFLKLVEIETGRKPMVYTNPRFWQDYLTNMHEMTKYPLWIAEYEMKTSAPETTAGWKTWHFWQFSPNGIVEGIAKPVDLNRYNGAPKALEAFLKNLR